jgi:HB1, ASXL, restriction endonuclease HTH domain
MMAAEPSNLISRRQTMSKTKSTKKAAAPKATRTAKVSKTAQKNRPKAAAKGKANAPAKPKKLSALDGAAKVLGETKKPMSCKDLIEAMAAKGYWTSTNGKTPANTLYSAILREIGTKGKEARFKKAERGKFVLA